MSTRATPSLDRVMRELETVAAPDAPRSRSALAGGLDAALRAGRASLQRRSSLPNGAARQLERAVQLWQRERTRRAV